LWAESLLSYNALKSTEPQSHQKQEEKQEERRRKYIEPLLLHDANKQKSKEAVRMANRQDREEKARGKGRLKRREKKKKSITSRRGQIPLCHRF